jgi:peptidoglycan-associated lipoprotein
MASIRIFAITAAVLILAGCSGSGSAAKDGAGAQGSGDGGPDASSSGMGADGLAQGGAMGGGMDGMDAMATEARDIRVIYFGYDESEVDADSVSVLEAHGDYLASNPNLTVRLEGHGDERGSREYNIGLGERRAQSVRQVLLLQGVGSVQLSTVSYGEERPAVLGSDEEAWSLNRRVELVYGN